MSSLFNLSLKSNEFKNAKPFKFGFIENVFHTEFYQKLFDTYLLHTKDAKLLLIPKSLKAIASIYTW